jgi:hypothetical protein
MIEWKKQMFVKTLTTLDLCTGHLMTQTCIMRYRPEDSHVIIMHPMPQQFDRVIADMDVLTYLDQNDIDKDLKLGERALPDPGKINFIESYHRQKMSNNIVFKFLNYPSDYLNYMVSFKFFQQQPNYLTLFRLLFSISRALSKNLLPTRPVQDLRALKSSINVNVTTHASTATTIRIQKTSFITFH